jgi:murein DD-endopeptidase MepM/ murein hydrolase activator NlpD
MVAHAGSTGSVSKPQLHFELRRGAHAVDPTKYL